MSKKEAQRSVYIETPWWDLMKEMAWQRRTSVSALIVQLIEKEAKRKTRGKAKSTLDG